MSIIKLFKDHTLFIETGGKLEEARKVIVEKGGPELWGYDNTYEYDDTVSSGYLHANGNRLFLSKNRFDKPEITLEQLEEQN